MAYSWENPADYTAQKYARLLNRLEAGRHRPGSTKEQKLKFREQKQQVIGWRTRLARRTFTIEVKLDIDDSNDNQAYNAMLMITKQYARDILASAVLLNDGRKQPAIACFTEDSFHTQSEIELLDPSEHIADASSPDSQ